MSESFKEIVLFAVAVFGVGLIMVMVLSKILGFFVALKATPTNRAGWTVGIAYLISAGALTFGAPEGYWIYAPLVPLPGALAVFWFIRRDFAAAGSTTMSRIPKAIRSKIAIGFRDCCACC